MYLLPFEQLYFSLTPCAPPKLALSALMIYIYFFVICSGLGGEVIKSYSTYQQKKNFGFIKKNNLEMTMHDEGFIYPRRPGICTGRRGGVCS